MKNKTKREREISELLCEAIKLLCRAEFLITFNGKMPKAWKKPENS